jgi:hypothetical protein
MESERCSHLRVALIRMDAGSAITTIRFAQSVTAAERSEWYPRAAPTPSAPYTSGLAATPWCVITATRLRRYNAVITAAPAPLHVRA